ncbi:MAG TPA: glycosyltransferase [Candidatus Dojkabacteria bacterium]|nr:glycosyltransferase [Candidatus Dojkabacteria bacterium]
MNPKVSILMPSFNYENYIKIAIDSVLQQTYTNWELIIIDDGSTDSSVSIIKEYKDKRIKLHTQKNRGVTKTLNKAFQLSKGEYICFLDADDSYHPNKLKEQIEMMQKGYDLVTTKVSAIDANGQKSGDKFFDLWWNLYNPEIIFGPNIEFKFFNGNYLCKSAVMLKSYLFKEYGMFNTNLITSYDLELWLKMLPHIKIARCDNILTYYRWHGLNETTTNTMRMKIELLLMYDKYLDSLKDKNYDRIKNYTLGFSYLINAQGIEKAYVALQVLKQTGEWEDTYEILKNKKDLEILQMNIDTKDTNYDIIREGQVENIEVLMRDTIWEKLRRKLIPLKLRSFLKKILS